MAEINFNFLFFLIFLIFLIIITIYISINILLRKEIESYGIYCGSYNINKSTAKQNCSKDFECIWNNYKTVDGSSSGWCGQNSVSNDLNS